MTSVVIILLIFCSIVYGNYDCSSESIINLALNEVAFFETNNYPEVMTKDDFSTCYLLIESNQSTDIHAFLYIVINELDSLSNVNKSSDFYVFDAKSFVFPIRSPANFVAEKGFILFEEKNTNNCPLESISKISPFKFIDETQILHITSKYYANQIRSNSCHWKFDIPVEYGLKIVIVALNVSTTTILRISNTTDIIANERSVKIYRPIYNNDQHIEIYLSKGDLNFEAINEFIASVSIVKKDLKKINDTCNIVKDGEYIVWSTKLGYANNIYCKLELTIPPNSQISGVPNYYQIEKYVDYIQYTTEDNITTILKEEGYIDLYSYNTDNDVHVLFEFFSDGSVQNMGFLIGFRTIRCVCDFSVIECDSHSYTPMRDIGTYCGNLNCTLVIKPCPTFYSHMNLIYFDSDVEDRYNFDNFKIISNNQTVYEINDLNNRLIAYNVYLNSSNTNFLEMITFPSHKLKLMVYSLRPFIAPSITLRVNLSTSNPLYIMDVGLIGIATVEIIDASNHTIVVSANMRDGTPLYEDESLTKSIVKDECFSDYYNCDTKRSKIALYYSLVGYRTTDYPFLAIQLSGKPKNCVFDKNIFATHEQPFLSISAISNAFGSCRIVIFTGHFPYIITHLFTSSSIENVKVYIGINMTNLFFEFKFDFNYALQLYSSFVLSSKTSHYWKDIRLYSTVYTIAIPKATSIYLTLLRFNDNQPISLQNPDPMYRSVVATPNYGTSKLNEYFIPQFIRYSIGNYPVKFTALNYNIQKPDIFFITSNTTTYYVNKTQDILIFQNQIITLVYAFVSGEKVRDGVLFFIEMILDY